MSGVDDLALGRLFREIRIRVNWSQADVAAKAKVSRSRYSDIERGMLEGVSLGKLRRVAAVLEVRLPLVPRWRGAEVDRLLATRHAAMAERVTKLLLERGWDVRAEVSFNWFGERGVVDLVAWHAASRTLLLVELKTELVDANELLGVTDRRRRLAPKIAEPFGWVPNAVADWVVVADSRTNRRRLAAVRTLVRSSIPSDGRAIARWLRHPVGPMSALSFLTDSDGAGISRRCAPRLRVRGSGTSVRRSGESA